MLTKAESRDSYGQHGVTWIDRFGVWLSQRAIRKYLPAPQGLDMLDLGCGYRATLLRSFTGEQKRLLGVDFQIAPEIKADPRLTFVEAAVEYAMPTFATATFDVVLLMSVLEHVWEPAEVLKQCHRVLRPRGVLLVNVPTWWGKFFLEFSAFTLGASPKLEMDDHKMYYDKRDLWPLLVAAGFKPSQIILRYHKFGLNLFARAQKEMDTSHNLV